MAKSFKICEEYDSPEGDGVTTKALPWFPATAYTAPSSGDPYIKLDSAAFQGVSKIDLNSITETGDDSDIRVVASAMMDNLFFVQEQRRALDPDDSPETFYLGRQKNIIKDSLGNDRVVTVFTMAVMSEVAAGEFTSET